MPGDEDDEEDLVETVRGAPDRAAGPGDKPAPDDEDEEDSED